MNRILSAMRLNPDGEGTLPVLWMADANVPHDLSTIPGWEAFVEKNGPVQPPLSVCPTKEECTILGTNPFRFLTPFDQSLVPAKGRTADATVNPQALKGKMCDMMRRVTDAAYVLPPEGQEVDVVESGIYPTTEGTPSIPCISSTGCSWFSDHPIVYSTSTINGQPVRLCVYNTLARAASSPPCFPHGTDVNDALDEAAGIIEELIRFALMLE